jgi:hypothetical protein
VVSTQTFDRSETSWGFAIPFAIKCDADKLENEGMEAEGLGEHPIALELFEQEVACKENPRGVQLAFMAACNASNIDKARHYFSKMTTEQREHIVSICIRNHISKAQLEAGLAKAVPQTAVAPGRLLGVVHDAANNRVVTHASITVKPGDKTGETDADGKFTADLAPGKYKVTVKAAGFAPQDLDVTIESDGVVIKNIDLRK